MKKVYAIVLGLLLSGLLHEQAPALQRAYRPWLDLETTASEDGWILMAGQKRAAAG